MSITDYHKPCMKVAPELRERETRSLKRVTEPVRRNRPSGHDGNCAYSTEHAARLWEWTQSEMMRRG
jgi:hypothetical protein